MSNPARLFIIEGPDCSGKSTLVRQIAVQRDALYLHASGKKCFHTSMLDYHQELLTAAIDNLANGHDVVMDRFWPSELVYGQLLRPHVSDRVYDFADIFQQLSGYPTTYVMCDDPEIHERHAKEQDPDHPYDRSQFVSIVESYRNLTTEMLDTPALPNLWRPGTPPAMMKFNVRRYNLLTDGETMGSFVDSL
jgi:thymidylate kinase